MIQVVYSRSNENKTLGDEYFIDMSILSTQSYDVDALNKHVMKKNSKILYIYFSINIVIIEDNANNGNYYPTKYLSSLSLCKLLQSMCPMPLQKSLPL